MREPEAAQSAYKVVDRLLALRDLLREKSCTLKHISDCMPEHYANDESGARKLRRDLQYLKRWGYQVVRDKIAKTYALTSDRIEYDWADDELTALAALRECFKGRAPYADALQAIFGHIENGLNDGARKRYKRKPPLRIELAVVEKHPQVGTTRQMLDRALETRQRISFKYCPLDRPRVIDHPDDEPLALEFRDGHYYLTAYCFKRNTIFDYRLDQIVEGSMQILPDRAIGGWQREMVGFQYRLLPKLARRGASLRFPEIVSYDPQKDGSLIVTARAYSEFDIIREILRYGEQAEIVGPLPLRAKMKRVVEQMCALYSRDDGPASKD
jgi:predicted DNA-binding transcriptional regulator YafY